MFNNFAILAYTFYSLLVSMIGEGMAGFNNSNQFWSRQNVSWSPSKPEHYNQVEVDTDMFIRHVRDNAYQEDERGPKWTTLLENKARMVIFSSFVTESELVLLVGETKDSPKREHRVSLEQRALIYRLYNTISYIQGRN